LLLFSKRSASFLRKEAQSVSTPADLTAIDLLAAYRSHELSPVEAVTAILARIEAWEPELGAIYDIKRESALVSARESERRWLRNEPAGALDGVPVTIKDLIATQGDPTPLGTAAAILTPAPEDGPPAARVREAGAVIIGKTTMPDFGMLSSGLSSYHRLSRNPWDLACNPGGSSSGAAGAAAAGLGPLHIGTDIGGSVRLPAGWCGIFALKPSFGRVPVDPPYIGRVAGPMTRTVRDSALLMSVLSGPDWRDHMSLPPQAIDWQDLRFDARGKRIGLMLEAGCGLATEPATAAAVTRAAALFAKHGAIVTPVKPILTQQLLDNLDLFWRTRFWQDISTYPSERRDRILPFILAWAQGAEGVTGSAVYAGFDAIMQLRRLGNEAMRGLDFILSPTAPIAAFPAELPCPTNDPARPFEHITFTVPYNMTEQPAASVNAGYTATGLPIGLQIVGRRFQDLEVLAAAAAFEDWRGAQRDWPTRKSASF
jgi:aspartyl-tRNA(Asn)/glutamyl-tRNA(Gln) amidotransferase subunit A